MPKPPRIPKSLGKKPPSTLPLSRGTTPSKAFQPRPTYKPSAGTKDRNPSEALEQAWKLRPRLSDIQRLPEEELNSISHRMKVGRWRQWPFFMCALTAFGMGMYGVMLYTSLSKGPAPEDVPYDLIDRFDREAEGYDEKVGFSETLLFLTSKRKELTKKAKGHVLEVAVGTGRNIPYYQTKQCATVTLLDTSGPMLDVAKRKWKDTHSEYFHRVFFKQQSALDPIVPPYGAQDGYDTVIETMGLCSTPEPVKLLQNLGACTKEDGGRILLLEHGKSHYEWLNYLLDQTAPAHADQHGCWWNKDIGKIVEESGLEVVNIKRYNFGTTWWVELKPIKGMRNQQAATISEQPPVSTESTGQAAQKSWLSLWR